LFVSVEEKLGRLIENVDKLENDGEAMNRSKFNAVQATNSDLVKSIEDELARYNFCLISRKPISFLFHIT
jgi:hypothetical protein